MVYDMTQIMFHMRSRNLDEQFPCMSFNLFVFIVKMKVFSRPAVERIVQPPHFITCFLKDKNNNHAQVFLFKKDKNDIANITVLYLFTL